MFWCTRSQSEHHTSHLILKATLVKLVSSLLKIQLPSFWKMPSPSNFFFFLLSVWGTCVGHMYYALNQNLIRLLGNWFCPRASQLQYFLYHSLFDASISDWVLTIILLFFISIWWEIVPVMLVTSSFFPSFFPPSWHSNKQADAILGMTFTLLL